MPEETPTALQRRQRSEAATADILEAQDLGHASFSTDPDGACPYPSDTSRNQALRLAWATGRAWARVQAMDTAGQFDQPQPGSRTAS